MRLRLFTTCAALSLLLGVGTAVMWATRTDNEFLVWYDDHRLSSGLCFKSNALMNQCVAQLDNIHVPRYAVPERVDRTWGGFRVSSAYGSSRRSDEDFEVLTHRKVWLVIPDWALLVATIILPVLWFRSWRRSRLQQWRIANKCCITCGYDLRASSERCPECGAAMTRTDQPATR